MYCGLGTSSIGTIVHPRDFQSVATIFKSVVITNALLGLSAGEQPLSKLDPAILAFDSYRSSDPEEEITEILLTFIINDVGDLPGTDPVLEGDMVTLVLDVQDSGGNQSIFTSNTVSVGPVNTALKFIIQPDQTARIAWSGSPFQINVVQPARLASSATVTQDGVAAGPMALRLPDYVGGGTSGDTMEIANTLFVSDAASPPPDLSFVHQSDGVDIPGEVAPQFTIPASLEGTAIRGGVQASSGTQSSNFIFSPEVIVPETVLLPRQSVKADGVAYLTNTSPLGVSAERILFFAQFTPEANRRQAILSLNGTTLALGTYDQGPGVRFSWRTEIGNAINISSPQDLTPGERVSVLGILQPDRSDIRLSICYQIAGQPTWIDAASLSQGGAQVDLDFGAGFRFFAQTNQNADWQFTGMLHRYALWADPSGNPDITHTGTQQKFLALGGDDLIHPDASVVAFGVPLFDLHGPAEHYNNRIINGSIGTVDAITGAFIDV